MNRKEALIQMAQQRGVDIATTKTALEDADREAISTLLKQLELASDSGFVIPKCIDEAFRAARDKSRILEVADVLLERRSNILYPLSHELGNFTDQKAVSLLRQIVMIDWASNGARDAAASALIYAAHYADCEHALQDPFELVRLQAVAQLERKHNTAALIRTLGNDFHRVRRVAAWYMGRNKVNDAVDALLKMISVEQDIEALRAAIWSLGVLRLETIQQQLQPFAYHENELIRKTTQDALAKLV